MKNIAHQDTAGAEKQHHTQQKIGSAQIKKGKKMKNINNGMRDPSPCKDCTRPWKKPGCHGTCPDIKPWLEELERIKKAKREYERTRYNRYHR